MLEYNSFPCLLLRYISQFPLNLIQNKVILKTQYKYIYLKKKRNGKPYKVTIEQPNPPD